MGVASGMGSGSVPGKFSFVGGPRGGSGDVRRRMAILDPLVNLGCQELPQASELVRGHALPGDPLVDRVRIDPEMRRDLVH